MSRTFVRSLRGPCQRKVTDILSPVIAYRSSFDRCDDVTVGWIRSFAVPRKTLKIHARKPIRCRRHLPRLLASESPARGFQNEAASELPI
ncbi:hypothetical protein RB2874 [Rhodopirellula baltica SH 1]|uniref:Uncharacterized protein n=1 Tax=Rhodopirellula baltica (strain DSM 10527 / NCIMB 13988 / SH1) TaxID=243090 RepID=Q7UV51_RHOBA|nr:hypothetical protein RB2874 [Rhodopirellula baltica SH 1]